MKRILICTDGSAYSEESYRYAAWIARGSDVLMDILYVTDLRQFEVPLIADISGSLGAQPYQNLISQLQQMEKNKAEFIEKQSEEILRASGFTGSIQFEHATGLLVDKVEQEGDRYNLVVVGKRGAHCDRAMAHLGSTMERVVRSSACPCLVTSRAYRKPEHLIFAYDGGESCKKALDYICKNPIREKIRLDLVTVVPASGDPAIEAELDEAVECTTKAGYAARKAVLQGPVDTTISDYVDKENGDFLIIGAYGHSRIRHLILGSTTTSLLRMCRVPVLCFR